MITFVQEMGPQRPGWAVASDIHCHHVPAPWIPRARGSDGTAGDRPSADSHSGSAHCPLLLLDRVPLQHWPSQPLPALWAPPHSGALFFLCIWPPGDWDCIFTALWSITGPENKSKRGKTNGTQTHTAMKGQNQPPPPASRLPCPWRVSHLCAGWRPRTNTQTQTIEKNKQTNFKKTIFYNVFLSQTGEGEEENPRFYVPIDVLSLSYLILPASP